ncbi:Ktr system potassium uptake protein C [Weissella viridescens]|jgi:trk system potassium uptake protein TrkA|nr:TrkA family potassium uptake protein [Weissella viridescens]MCB6840520.1 TrkA family potassium uptake protein [Weissella viridescens]MCB6847253.1 TrkA family potassium uptake protein [Weissella viridescens]QOD86058.1 TrkA family potassium uptake protein [Weissella viridescens]SOB43239.1 Ktr system potassium uptake protein C [Weissella viridescens]SUP52331.1 Ktr system potassium uptake protein A [Weissella viridescens]
MQQTYAIIGLGRFGSSLLEALINANQEVLAIDKDPERVEDYMEVATHAVIADAQEEEALVELDLTSFDHVVVCIGHNQQASILTTILLKDLGVHNVIAKAENKLHARVLDKVGADQVVRPETEMAQRLAEQLISPNVLSFVDLGDATAFAEIKVANLKFSNQTIAELDIQGKYGLTVVSIKSQGDITISPEVDTTVQIGDIITVIGKHSDVQRLDEALDKTK